MIPLNKEINFVSNYVMEKEFFYPDLLRRALNEIYFQIRKRKKNPPLAVHIVNQKFIKKYNQNYTKEFLWKMYRARLAHVKNAKEKYKLWAFEKRKSAVFPVEKKLCECGCQQEVKKGNRFINGHNSRCKNSEVNENQAKLMRQKKKILNTPNVIFIGDLSKEVNNKIIKEVKGEK